MKLIPSSSHLRLTLNEVIMKELKIALIMIILIVIVIITGCSKDKGTTAPDISTYTDTQLYTEGWSRYTAGNYTGAITYFNVLLSRENKHAEALHGIAWCQLRLFYFNNSKQNFINALTADSLYPVLTADTLWSDIYAGVTFINDLQGNYDECLTAAGQVNEDWYFRHDEQYDFRDIILIKASSYYAKGQFTSSLAEVRKIEPAYTTDVSFVDGRIALARKIEELKLAYN